MSWAVDRASYWSDLPTEFPALGAHLPDREPRWQERRACVIGASDGKFVLPLLRKGWRVTALESDPVFLLGGEILLRGGPMRIGGMRRRLDGCPQGDACTVVQADYMRWSPPAPFDLVVLSGVWTMDQNRVHPLRALVRRTQDYVAPGGLLFAEYFAPNTDEERGNGYCPEIADMDAMFAAGWSILESRDLGVSAGESHVGWEEWHSHRYAVMIARRSDG